VSLLEVDDIDAYYGESHIIRGLSMNIEEGEVCALLGRNGAGKTTTLRSIAGAEPPTVESGTVTFDGTDITDMRVDDIAVRGISLVPEERRVFADLTVAENIRMAEVARNRSNTWNRTVTVTDGGMSREEIYDDFPRLDERRDQKAGTLSGGEQQMLAIARALRQGTELLMLDEPYEGLAPQIVEDVEAAVQRIADAGTTILLVEQNAAAAINISDRAYIIDQGSMVFEGEAEELREAEDIRQQYLGV
jgi:branched-chain amino acid transport system ATP-binding protein